MKDKGSEPRQGVSSNPNAVKMRDGPWEDLGQLWSLKGTVAIELPSLQIPIASSEVPTPPSNFNNLLEGLTELTESYYTHGYGLLKGKDTD